MMRQHTKQWRHAAAVLALAACATGCGDKKQVVAPPPIPVKVAAVERYEGSPGVIYSANIVPYSQVPLLFKSGGFVTSILQRKGADGRDRNIQQGDTANKGVVLATVRQQDYRNAVDQAKGQLDQAVAAQAKSQKDMQRANALLAAQAMTQANYDAVKQQLDTANGAVETAHGALNQAQQSLADCELRMPIDGLVLSRNIELGALVAAGTQGFTVADTHLVKAVFGIPDTLLSTVKLGNNQVVTTESIGQPFVGKVTAVTPQADPKSRTFQVEVTIPNPRGDLLAGMVASLNLGRGKLATPVPVVPLNAIVSSRENNTEFNVFVVVRDGGREIARRRAVQTGNTYGDRVGITSGLQPGEFVITNGATMITDGQEVRVVP